MYKRIYPSLLVETDDPDIVAAVVKNFRSNRAFWQAHFNAVFGDFAAEDDCVIPRGDWMNEVLDNLKVSVHLPLSSGHVSVFEMENDQVK